MKIKFILFIFISIWVALIVRVFILSIQSNNYYSRLSYNNTIKIEKIAPVRGEILDRNGVPLAINKLGFKIQIKPHLSSSSNIHLLKEEIKNITNLFPELDKDKLIKKYKKQDSYYNSNYITLVDFMSYNEIINVYTKLTLRDNIKIISSPKRYYPYNEVASHIIGYVSKANKNDIKNNKLLDLIGYTGKSGVEKYYNDYLQGKAGSRKIKVNASNQEIEELSYQKAIEDRKLTLSLDVKLQNYISSLFKNKVGSVVVMDINGSILAAGSFPEYDLNTFVSGISYKKWNKLINNPDKPFTNKITNGLYPPGSIIKPALGLVYISTELTKNWSIHCNAKFPLGKRVFRCWKSRGHGKTNITKAIRESCDDYFYKGSLKVGIDKMSEGLSRYGLGKKTGVDLPNEFIGVVPSRDWKRKKYNQPWYIGETVNTSIGQGDVLVTPLQIAQLTALMATAKLPTPHFAYQIGSKLYKPSSKNILTTKELKELPIIQNAMYEVCNNPYGTATKHLRLEHNIKIAGKTGTAQVVKILQDIKKRESEHDMSYYNRSHAWFTSYGPYKKPKYIVTILVEHGGHGGIACGGIASNIYNKLYELGYLK